MSDCISAWVTENPITHIIAQTHGWNVPPDKAVAVPFTAFMGGMQNYVTMPEDGFNPICVAFIWTVVQIGAVKAENAPTFTELIIQSEKESRKTGATDISDANEAARVSMEIENPDEEEFNANMAIMSNAAVYDDLPDEDGKMAVNRGKETVGGPVIEGFLSIFTPILRPFGNIVFLRLTKVIV